MNDFIIGLIFSQERKQLLDQMKVKKNSGNCSENIISYLEFLVGNPDNEAVSITGLSIALAFSICCCIPLAVLAAILFRQLENEDKGKGTKKDALKRRSSNPECYADNYYDSIDPAKTTE